MKVGCDNVISECISTSIRKGVFLPSGNAPNSMFNGTDSEELFKSNLLAQPIDWFYRNNPIEYKTNTNGYRTAEFDSIDWANSIVIFGCSHVFGVGLHEEDTIASQLAKITATPVINMGMGASSIEYSLYNSIILNQHYPTPKAVVQIYSSIDRTTYYGKKNVTHHGPWNMKKYNYMDLYSNDATHAKVHASMAQMITRQLWSDKTKLYEASFLLDASENLQVFLCKTIDKARDFSHPGPITAGLVASHIATNLKL